MCASSNHRKAMKAEHGGKIPRQLSANPKPSILEGKVCHLLVPSVSLNTVVDLYFWLKAYRYLANNKS